MIAAKRAPNPLIVVRDKAARHERQVLAELAQAVTAGDAPAMADRLHKLDEIYFGWRRFCQHVVRANCDASAEIRAYCDRTVAEGLANGIWRTFEGGSVPLQTTAAPSAIICAVGDNSSETEYLVDRRALDAVTVLQRLGQLSIDEYQKRAVAGTA